MKFYQSTCSLFFLFTAVAATAQQPVHAGELRIVLANVQFAANKSSVGPEAARVLDELAVLLKNTPAATAEIGAHTDASGSAPYNLRLSQQRASAVSMYLTKKGVAAKRLKAKGYGESKLLNRCKRGVRCSEAEKRQNRRVELRIQGAPADSLAQARWLALGQVLFPRKPVQEPTVPKLAMPPAQTSPGIVPPNSSSAELSPPGFQGDYFPELTGRKTSTPKPLPYTFTGYTIEITSIEKPIAAGNPLLQKHEIVFLRQEAGGPYCYFVGAFFTLPEAQQFFQEKIRADFPQARIAAFSEGNKKHVYH